MKKDEYRETILTIDTRGSNPLNGLNSAEAAADTEFDEQPTPALENAIQTKYVKLNSKCRPRTVSRFRGTQKIENRI